MRTALLIWVALLLAGCISVGGGGKPTPVVKVRVEICPVQPPAVSCPALPILGPAPPIEALEDGWIDAQEAHGECSEALAVWNAAYAACKAQQGLGQQ